MNENRCVCCNKSIPEGKMVCAWCESNVTIVDQINKPVVELTKGELTNEIIKLGKQILDLEKAFDKLSLGYLALCNTLGVRH